MICKEMEVLPSNPDFKHLTDFQIGWIIQNIVLDFKLEEKAFKKATGDKSIGYDVSDIKETSLDNLVEIMKQKLQQKKNNMKKGKV